MVSKTFELDQLINQASIIIGDKSDTIPSANLTVENIVPSIIDDHMTYGIQALIPQAIIINI